MKKCHKALLISMPIFFMLSLAIPLASVFAPAHTDDEIGEDTAVYDTNLEHAKYGFPDVTRDGEGEEEEPAVEVNKVTLHYYNENADCDKRAFYIWATGVDGIEYSNTYNNEGDIVTVSQDRTMMTIVLDFEKDARFSYLNKRSGLWFIIKFKRISDSQLNWGGQSDDVFLRYEEFAESIGTSKHCEVWAMPAAGGGIVIFDMEEKTKVHGIKLANFTDWKTIECDVTDDTSKIWYKIYALDETYFRIKERERAAKKKNYLVREVPSVTISSNKKITIKFDYEIHPNMVYQIESHDPNTDSQEGMATLNKIVTVGFANLYDTAKFHTYYENAHKNVKDFGVTYTPQGATFKVWSPMSAKVTLMVYDTDTSSEYGGEDKAQQYNMHYTSGGIWELTVDPSVKGDCYGKYYNYKVDNVLGSNVCMDPYATSAGRCGVRGLIYDPNGNDVKPEGWDALPTKWDGIDGYDIETPQELSIYEVHVQDFTGDESWVSKQGNKRGTYKAFVESGTTVGSTDISTGYDHLKDLGVKAVQLMPMFDHDNDESKEELKYNWGYNPLNYNVVEGGYSSKASDGFARVKEFRELVLKLSEQRQGKTTGENADEHTRVIMDVVYNHVSSASGSAFNKLMPRYYFRYAGMDYDFWYDDGYPNGKKPAGSVWVAKGELFDGSGCHNEVATERVMMRKYIIDSLCMWAKNYKVKGFRFDLMGLIDWQTLNEARKALSEIDPDIYIYGEGWTSGGYHGEGSQYYRDSHPNEQIVDNWGADTWHIYHKCNSFKVEAPVYLGGFNDYYRNGTRGGNDQGDSKYPGSGLIQSGAGGDQAWATAQGLWGANDAQKGFYPEQTVNYVSCHDNYTARDQFFNTLTDGQAPTALQLLRASIQAHALTMAGNAAAFMLGGEELLRTKEISKEEYDANVGKTINAGDVVEMYGHKISHNSYNVSLDVNGFKWGNKIKVEVKNDTSMGGNSEITNEEFKYNDAFKSLVRMHQKVHLKRGINLENVGDNEKYDAFIKVTSTGKTVVNATWGGGEYGIWEGAGVAMQCDETMIYMQVNGTNGYLWGDHKIASGEWGEPIFSYGYSSYSDESNRINFGGDQNAIVIYNAWGHM